MPTLETAPRPTHSPAKTSYKLSPEEIKFFHDNGYLGPFQLCSPEEMETIREKVIAEVYDATGTDAAVKVPGNGVGTGKLGTQFRSTHPLHGQSRHMDNQNESTTFAIIPQLSIAWPA